MVLILGDTHTTYLVIDSLALPCLSVHALPAYSLSSRCLPAAIQRSVTYPIPGGARTENVCFAIVEGSPTDVLVNVSWLMSRGINPGESCVCRQDFSLIVHSISPQRSDLTICIPYMIYITTLSS
ncbi:hypothetical protein BDN70DRAFT_624388 [Pholiota conissans]|uniref:Uncharacterized protein n=1 Tax=Pholiota conissans TaxID=109636 RepID=A0A9P5Z546_9AGAR|nr:hypothetical protein BDN70DRAFT_624388 [Pholiota conissans]